MVPLFSSVHLVLTILLLITPQVEANFYCYVPFGGLLLTPNSQSITPECPPAGGTNVLQYDRRVQLCCSQSPATGLELIHTYDVIPDPGIPADCHYALHLPLNPIQPYQCSSSTRLCEAGNRYHLCCIACPTTELPGDFTSLSSTRGTTVNDFVFQCSRGNSPSIDINEVGGNTGHACPPNEEFNPAANCCVPLAGAGIAAPGRIIQGQQGRVGGLAGVGQQQLGTGTGCQDRAVPGKKSDCPAARSAGLCDSSLYRDLMTVQCPATCGRCGQVPANAQFFDANVPSGAAGGCFDREGPDGKSDCASRMANCDVPVWRTFMREECPFTCKVCGPGALATGGRISIVPLTTSTPAALVPPDLDIPAAAAGVGIGGRGG